MKLSYAQVYTVAISVGMPNPRVMAAIAMAESGGDTAAHNPTPPDDSYGLWQINMYGSLGPSRRKSLGLSSNTTLYNPFANAVAAKKILGQQGLGAWSTYTSGAYLKHMSNRVPTQADQNAVKAAWKPFQDWNDPFDLWDEDKWGPAPKSPWEGLTGQTPPESLGGVSDAVGQLTRLGDILAKAGDWLSEAKNWVRIAYVAGGIALVIGGLTVIARPLINEVAASSVGGTVMKAAQGTKGVTK